MIEEIVLEKICPEADTHTKSMKLWRMVSRGFYTIAIFLGLAYLFHSDNNTLAIIGTSAAIAAIIFHLLATVEAKSAIVALLKKKEQIYESALKRYEANEHSTDELKAKISQYAQNLINTPRRKELRAKALLLKRFIQMSHSDGPGMCMIKDLVEGVIEMTNDMDNDGEAAANFR